MKTINLLKLFAIVVLALPNSFAQQKHDEEKTPKAPLEIRTNLMVVDSSNQYIDGLNIGDVKLFEDDVEQKVTALTKRERGANVVLVIDNTGSMRSQLDRVIEATALLVENLDPRDDALMVRFVSGDKIKIVEDWTSDKTKMIKAIKDKLYIEGGQSAVTDAVYFATQQLKDRNKSDPSDRASIVLISDCEDRDSFYNQNQLFEALKGSNIQIFTIALTRDLGGDDYLIRKNSPQGKAETYAKNLATNTGGNRYILDKVTDDTLKNAIKSVMFELRSQYSISYTSTNPKRNETRKLRIEVTEGQGAKRRIVVRKELMRP